MSLLICYSDIQISANNNTVRPEVTLAEINFVSSVASLAGKLTVSSSLRKDNWPVTKVNVNKDAAVYYHRET